MRNFHPLEAVGRDSDTQLQVVENLIVFDIFIQRFIFCLQ